MWAPTDGFPDNMETDPEYVSVSITADELQQIELVLRTSGARLKELYKKVNCWTISTFLMIIIWTNLSPCITLIPGFSYRFSQDSSVIWRNYVLAFFPIPGFRICVQGPRCCLRDTALGHSERDWLHELVRTSLHISWLSQLLLPGGRSSKICCCCWRQMVELEGPDWFHCWPAWWTEALFTGGQWHLQACCWHSVVLLYSDPTCKVQKQWVSIICLSTCHASSCDYLLGESVSHWFWNLFPDFLLIWIFHAAIRMKCLHGSLVKTQEWSSSALDLFRPCMCILILNQHSIKLWCELASMISMSNGHSCRWLNAKQV